MRLHRGRTRSGLLLCLILGCALALSGCGSQAQSGGADVTPAAGAAASAVCSDFSSWREAQDALDAAGESDELDYDGDGVACVYELGQEEYEEGWDTGYENGCSWIFDQSTTGSLYSYGTEYTVSDCENVVPYNKGAWEPDAFSEPAEDGEKAGWASACEATFGAFGDLYWGDAISVSQSDCEFASP